MALLSVFTGTQSTEFTVVFTFKAIHHQWDYKSDILGSRWLFWSVFITLQWVPLKRNLSTTSPVRLRVLDWNSSRTTETRRSSEARQVKSKELFLFFSWEFETQDSHAHREACTCKKGRLIHTWATATCFPHTHRKWCSPTGHRSWWVALEHSDF